MVLIRVSNKLHRKYKNGEDICQKVPNLTLGLQYFSEDVDSIRINFILLIGYTEGACAEI
jgi:hypothetical protein